MIGKGGLLHEPIFRALNTEGASHESFYANSQLGQGFIMYTSNPLDGKKF